MPELTFEDEYWDLVHKLMIHGWYRAGQGPADDFERTQWGFREGHLRDVLSSPPLWIPARGRMHRHAHPSTRGRERRCQPSITGYLHGKHVADRSGNPKWS
jgi:hypothetical protein